MRLYRISDGGRTFMRIGPAGSVGGDLVVRDGSVYLLSADRARAGVPAPHLSLWALHPGGSWRRLSAPCPRTGPYSYGAGALALAAWSANGLALACGGEPAAGNQAKVFYSSTDGGVHWRLAGHLPGGGGMGPGYIDSLAAASSKTWALALARYAIEVTHDGGRDWQIGASTFPNKVEGWGYVAFTDATHAVAVPWALNGSVLAFTSDAGDNWTQVAFPSGR